MYQRILVPFDGSPTSRRGLDEAIQLATLTHASLRLIYMVEDLLYTTGFEAHAFYASDVVPLMRKAGEKILLAGKASATKAGVPVDTVLLEGTALRLSDVVAEQAQVWGADLIVIGTHGRHGVGRLLLGSDAEQIARTAPVPVLLVRASKDMGARALASGSHAIGGQDASTEGE